MDVFYHLIYEHNRGLRDLALYTLPPEKLDWAERELQHENVDYLFRPLEDGRVNVYFGHKSCVDVIRSFGSCPHCRLTPEQDFMLGIMLGYDRTRQCERFLARRRQCRDAENPCGTRELAGCLSEQDAEQSIG